MVQGRHTPVTREDRACCCASRRLSPGISLHAGLCVCRCLIASDLPQVRNTIHKEGMRGYQVIEERTAMYKRTDAMAINSAIRIPVAR